MVPQTVGDSVGAEDEAVAGLADDLADLRVDELVAGTERLRQNVLAIMRDVLD